MVADVLMQPAGFPQITREDGVRNLPIPHGLFRDHAEWAHSQPLFEVRGCFGSSLSCYSGSAALGFTTNSWVPRYKAFITLHLSTPVQLNRPGNLVNPLVRMWADESSSDIYRIDEVLA
jgi:hypothetical protein